MHLFDKQLTEYEFEMLAKAGSDLIERMVLQRIRVYGDESEDLINDVIEYAKASARHPFYVKKDYQQATLYFAAPIDIENVKNFMSTHAKNIES